MLYSCVSHVTRTYTGLWCFKAYVTRYKVIFTLVVGDVGGVFCVFVVVVDADRHFIIKMKWRFKGRRSTLMCMRLILSRTDYACALTLEGAIAQFLVVV